MTKQPISPALLRVQYAATDGTSLFTYPSMLPPQMARQIPLPSKILSISQRIRILAAVNRTVMNLLFMNILDVSSEMRDSAKSSLAVVTFMWLVMVSLVLPVKLSVSAGHRILVSGRRNLPTSLGSWECFETSWLVALENSCYLSLADCWRIGRCS